MKPVTAITDDLAGVIMESSRKEMREQLVFHDDLPNRMLQPNEGKENSSYEGRIFL